jgi:two-component system chemotaxis sensor kinase CheA
MSESLEKINKDLEAVAFEIVSLEGGDIPAMGRIMTCLSNLEANSREISHTAFFELVLSLKGYLEKLMLSETDDIEPLEEGIICLQSMYRSLSNQQSFEGDTSSILEKLSSGKPVKERAELPRDDGKGDVKAEGGEVRSQDRARFQDQALSDEDREIMRDFVFESLENLETIELSLIELEQDSEDLDTINAIFRPFHTIKGVSGFLDLEKINKLAHASENLLDKARNGEIGKEGMMVDLILESVDLLKKMIQGVLEGLERGVTLDSGLDPTPLIRRIDEIIPQADETGDGRVGEILVHKGAVTVGDVEDGLERQKREPERKIGKILVEDKKTDSKEVISALRHQKKFGRDYIDLHVKVDIKKLDNLMDLTGELVIAQAMLRQNPLILSASDQKLYHNINQLNQITSSLQTTAMSMRMVPIKITFQKMVRLVRDLAKNSGKEVDLQISGEDTEIDRNVVEELYEPMIHMIRNAIDHGIEPPEERVTASKDEKGTIHLRAHHQGGNIIIEIEDDGRGLNKEKILERAKANNLITDESKITDSQIYNLIFHAGLTTAKKVTDVSGRGVGMDVVKKAIEKLRGRVEINSRPGSGSTFIISLPLTLAIIEGMLVRIGHERYIIPAVAILESFRPDKDQYSTVKGKGEMILSRGKLIPLVRLDRVFGVKGDTAHPCDGLVVAVENDGEQRCLLLDELLGKEEVVIKSLGGSLKHVKGIAGGAIMGDGRVGLILDMAGIFEIAAQNW